MFEKKRQLILRTAFTVFLERGYEGITIESIADALGYTKPALYYYFKNKDELISSLVLEYLRETRSQIRQIFKTIQPSKERLREFIMISLEQNNLNSGYFIMHHHLTRLIQYTQRTENYNEIQDLSKDISKDIIQLMTECVEQKEVLQEDPKVLGTIIRGMVCGSLTLMGTPPLSTMDPTALKTLICDMIMRGIEL